MIKRPQISQMTQIKRIILNTNRTMVLLLAVLTTATAWAQTVQFPIYADDEGTEAKPYQIKTAADLVKLSEDVNSGTDYRSKYFKLMNDIDFSPSSTWNDITSKENNFNPIGQADGQYSFYNFRGTFDGNDKTISGIRIYKGTGNNSSQYAGLFGFLTGTVKKLTLTDTRIIGYSNTGGIAGYCGPNSLVDHCTVTSTVAIYAIQSGARRLGGIVGHSSSMTATITNNTSSATVAIKDGLTGCENFGGIQGGVNSEETLSNNLAIGATVKDSNGKSGAIIGAIMGNDDIGANITNNYYINCTVNGTANALNVGCSTGDITGNCAAVSLYTLTLADGITTTTAPTITISGTDYYAPGTTITLSGMQTGTPPVGYIYGDSYIVNGTANSGNTFDMPAQDTEVTSTTVPVYPLTLADGITTTTTPAITFGDTPYYLAGTTITLSGELPEVSGENEVASYTVNGKKIIGNSFTMPAEAVTVGAAIFTVEWPGDGIESSPYLIQSCDDLRKLAQFVNTGAEDADGQRYGEYTKWYKLVADLQFDYADLGETESNFEAIGNDVYQFSGHFLGNGHTIRGIRIRKGNENYQGLFGNFGNTGANAVISGVILDDADITGKSYTGGIVGYNREGGTVTDCHVTNTVIIRATADGASSHGGIVGTNGNGNDSFGNVEETVSGCTSAATLTIENGATGCNDFGGIAGNNAIGTLSDNLALGVHLPNRYFFGAIISNKSEGTYLRNYYSGCTKDGGETAHGCPEGDFPGIEPGIALYDHSVFSGLNSHTLQTVENKDNTSIFKFSFIDLAGRTLYKDGNWNVLCLPFEVYNLSDTPLAGATVMELDVDNQWTMDNGQWIIDNESGTYQTGLDGTTLYLFFKPVGSIVSGRPYIVKWETTGEPIENPVFQASGIYPEPEDVTSQDGKVQFNGIYDPTLLSNDGGSNLCIGTDSQLYWPSSDETLNAFRFYLHVDGTVQAIQSNLTFGLMGDVNGNGGIDIGDAVCIVNYLVNKNNTVFKDKLADLNGNGGIDIGDAVMIVNILVGKTGGSQTTGKGLQTTDYNEPQ